MTFRLRNISDTKRVTSQFTRLLLHIPAVLLWWSLLDYLYSEDEFFWINHLKWMVSEELTWCHKLRGITISFGIYWKHSRFGYTTGPCYLSRGLTPVWSGKLRGYLWVKKKYLKIKRCIPNYFTTVLLERKILKTKILTLGIISFHEEKYSSSYRLHYTTNTKDLFFLRWAEYSSARPKTFSCVTL